MNKMKEEIRSKNIETYGVLRCVDESILNLNPFLEKQGYSLLVLNLSELEEKFAGLFSLPEKFDQTILIQINENEPPISQEFRNAVMSNSAFGHDVISSNKLILLKMNEEKQQNIIDETTSSLMKYSQAFNELQKFMDVLIKQLRLFKTGDINDPIKFQINKDTRKIFMKTWTSRHKGFSRNQLKITKEEAKDFESFYNPDMLKNKLTDLALENFNLSYEISEEKSKYMILMTALESLFNQGRDQITHIVSRHLSLLVSDDVNEFQDNYSRMKTLYGIRSTIVHGDVIKKNMEELNLELEGLVRRAINYCLSIKMNREELFKYLNAKGYK